MGHSERRGGSSIHREQSLKIAAGSVADSLPRRARVDELGCRRFLRNTRDFTAYLIEGARNVLNHRFALRGDTVFLDMLF